jgi:FKBP-type peptidyl-prolyl cis-trans isomerase SlyD
MTDDAEAAAEDDTEESEAPAEGFVEGDFVELAYTARTVDDGRLVDTTDAEVAEEEGVGEDQDFGPRTIVLGEGHIFGPVEDDILGADVGDTGSVVVEAADAFGAYDQDQVRTVSADKIPEDDRYPGAHVDVEGEHGHVETIIGGRARVDFNHPLAGEDIEYEHEVLGEVEDREERAQGLIEMLLDVELEVWFETETEEDERVVEPEADEEPDEDADVEAEEDADVEADEDTDEDADVEVDDEPDEEPTEPETEIVEVDKETLYIEAVPQLSMNQQWMMGKQQIAQQLIDQLDVDRVIVQETLEGMGAMGMPGMMGGAGGGGLEEALEDADVDADDLAEEIDEISE